RTGCSNKFWEAASVPCHPASAKEPDIMSRKHLAALAIALALLSEPAAAELRGTPEEPPVFTAAEVAVITRNAILAALIQDNPWVVRRGVRPLGPVRPTPDNASEGGLPGARPPGRTLPAGPHPDL